MRRLIPFLIKAAVSGVLLYIALDFIRVETLQQRLNRLDWMWAAAGLMVLSTQIVLVAQRWRLIARSCGADLQPRQALLYILIGFFFSQTLPSTVGGDAARIWLLARTSAGWKIALNSVLIDRFAGLIWLALLVLVCLPWSLDLIQNPMGRAALLVIGSGGIAGLAALYLMVNAGHAWLGRWSLTRHLTDTAGEAWRVLTSARVGSAVAVLSIVVHLLTVLIALCAARAIGAPLNLLLALLLIPPVILISAIPVSIAGWGVREGALIAAFSYAGLPEGEGLLVSLLLGALMFVTGAVAGLAWILSGQHVPVAPTQDGA